MSSNSLLLWIGTKKIGMTRLNLKECNATKPQSCVTSWLCMHLREDWKVQESLSARCHLVSYRLPVSTGMRGKENVRCTFFSFYLTLVSIFYKAGLLGWWWIGYCIGFLLHGQSIMEETWLVKFDELHFFLSSIDPFDQPQFTRQRTRMLPRHLANITMSSKKLSHPQNPKKRTNKKSCGNKVKNGLDWRNEKFDKQIKNFFFVWNYLCHTSRIKWSTFS